MTDEMTCKREGCDGKATDMEYIRGFRMCRDCEIEFSRSSIGVAVDWARANPKKAKRENGADFEIAAEQATNAIREMGESGRRCLDNMHADRVRLADDLRKERAAHEATKRELADLREDKQKYFVKSKCYGELAYKYRQRCVQAGLIGEEDRMVADEWQAREAEVERLKADNARLGRQLDRLIHGKDIEADDMCEHELEVTRLTGEVERLKAELDRRKDRMLDSFDDLAPVTRDALHLLRRAMDTEDWCPSWLIEQAAKRIARIPVEAAGPLPTTGLASAQSPPFDVSKWEWSVSPRSLTWARVEPSDGPGGPFVARFEGQDDCRLAIAVHNLQLREAVDAALASQRDELTALRQELAERRGEACSGKVKP